MKPEVQIHYLPRPRGTDWPRTDDLVSNLGLSVSVEIPLPGMRTRVYVYDADTFTRLREGLEAVVTQMAELETLDRTVEDARLFGDPDVARMIAEYEERP